MKTILFYRVVSNNGLFGLGAGYVENVIKDIQSSESDILFRINSPGGSVFDGYAIIQHLKEAKERGVVNMIVDGYACSMGGVFLAYGDNVKVSQLARIMLHKAYNPYLDPEEDKEEIDFIKTINQDIKGAFAKMIESRGKDPSFLDEIFGSDDDKDYSNGGKQYWFNAEEAVKFGLADEVVEENHLKLVADIDLKQKYYEIFQTNSEVVEMNILDKFKNKDGEVTIETLFGKVFDSVGTVKDEIIELVNNTKTEIVEAINSVNEKIKTSNEEFENLISENNEIASHNFKELEANLNEAIANIEMLQDENARLKSALEVIGTDGKVNVVDSDPKPKTTRTKQVELINEIHKNKKSIKS